MNAEIDPNRLADSVLSGNRRALARAITLVESTRADHRRSAEALLERILPETGRSARIGISGVPGVGKSTFIESFGMHVIEQGHQLAVLAVDPSSRRSGGSILGDKTRMEELGRRPEAFIRPAPAGRTLGGVARRTRESMLVCEAAGFDLILVETVGVGQSETAVADMVDMFLLLLLPSGGDELQGIKRGIMEIADLVIVNKADGDMRAAAQRAAAEYQNALYLLQPASPAWTPKVLTCSALERAGMDKIWEEIRANRAALDGRPDTNGNALDAPIPEPGGTIANRRRSQALEWMWSDVTESLTETLRADPGVATLVREMEAAVTAGETAPGAAARRLLEAFLKH